MFDLEKLIADVFDPQAGERITFTVDVPRDGVEDNDAWRARRDMAKRWREVMTSLAERIGFEVLPLVTYPATGANNADLPETGWLDGREVGLQETLAASTLVVAMTEFSATAPLTLIAHDRPDFRAASMAGVEERMERTALAADYQEVARRCRSIADIMRGALLLEVTFSTGHRAWFDLRHRSAELDDGHLPRFKDGDRVINLPSGETFIVPYEGEYEDEPSWTAGSIPVVSGDEIVVFHVTANTILAVEGDGPAADHWSAFFDYDPARANIAEVAFGVNDKAQVTGRVIEDEKAGFHWAFGRSDHLGGVVGVDDFTRPDGVVHQDIVYAKGSPIQVESAAVLYPDGGRKAIIADGEYLI